MKSAVLISMFLAAAAAPDARASVIRADAVEAGEVRTPVLSLPPGGEPDAVLYYPFEESSGQVAVDYSASGFDGAVTGAVWSSSGRFHGGAMSFDGHGDSISVGMEPNFPTWNQYSVSIWFLHDGGGDTGPQYGHKMLDMTSWYHDWYLKLNRTTDGSIGVLLQEGGVARGMGDSSKDYRDGQWHHVAVVRDGNSGQFWVDGVKTGNITNMISVTSTSALCVGNSFSGDPYQCKAWSGMLDEVQIYDRPLSAAEIGNLHSIGLLRHCGVEVATNLVVGGSFSVSGGASFKGGVTYMLPLGDLSCGSYTNAP